MDFLISDILFYVFAALALLASVLVVAFRNPVTSAMCMAMAFAMTAAVLFGLGAHFMGIIQIIVYAGAIIVLFLFVVMLVNVKAEERAMRNPVIVCLGVCIAAIFAGMIANVSLALPGAFSSECPCARVGAAIDELKIGDAAATPATQATTPAAACPDAALSPAQKMACLRSGIGGPLPKLDPARAMAEEAERNNRWSPHACLDASKQPVDQACETALKGGFPDTALLGRTLFTSYNIHFVFLGVALLIASVGGIALARRFRRND